MKKIIMLVLDGFGIRTIENGNATKMTNLPNISNILNNYSVSELRASAEDVGLPKGVTGNCEAGHITLGCGRVVKQPYTIINESIKDKTFFENDTLLDLMDHVSENNSTLHLIGLLSDAGIHSSLDHFYAILALAKIRKINNVVFHFITDGVDNSIRNAYEYINNFSAKVNKLGLGRLGTLCGRYYALDNEGNYDRIKKYYDLLTGNIGNVFTDYAKCLDLHYKNNISDVYINPSVITKGSNICDGDGVLFVDFRPERMEELISPFVDSTFDMFPTKKYKDVEYLSLYSTSNKIQGAYKNEELDNTFGKYLSELDYKQARIAEQSRFQHVTYFFDGAQEFSNKNMNKVMIQAQQVPRSDAKPEMSIVDVTNAALKAMDEDVDFILVNYANPEVVARTGNVNATMRALEACDVCIGKLLEKAQENFYELVITSDHGNVELLIDDNKISTGNTSNSVPFVICNEEYKLKETGTLCDVIPTIIDVFKISKPKEMTGESLIINEEK